MVMPRGHCQGVNGQRVVQEKMESKERRIDRPEGILYAINSAPLTEFYGQVQTIYLQRVCLVSSCSTSHFRGDRV